MNKENLVKYSKGAGIAKPSWNGTQRIFIFENGYGASVVRHQHSFGGDQGLYELAVVTFPTEDPEDFQLTYDTPITEDVIGFLTWDEVEKIKEDIKELPPFLYDKQVFVA